MYVQLPPKLAGGVVPGQSQARVTGAGSGGILSSRAVALSGFGSLEAAARFCTAHDELRDSFRSWRMVGEAVSLTEQRRLFGDRWAALLKLITS